MPDGRDPHPDDQRLAEAWESYTTEAMEVPMSEPTEIRRSGDRRRRTRRGVVVGVGLAAVLVAGTGVAFGAGLLGGDAPQQVTGTPSPTPSNGPTGTATPEPSPRETPTSAGPAETSTSEPPVETASPGDATDTPTTTPAEQIDDGNLPSGQEIYFETPGDMGDPLIQDGLTTASGEDRLFICERDENLPAGEPQGLAEQPGLVSARSAIFSGDNGIRRAHVMQLDSPESASAVADTIRGWVDDCANRVTGNTGEPGRGDNEPSITVAGARVDFSVQMRPVSEGEGAWNGILVIVSGDRVLIVGDFVRGQDYNVVGPAVGQENPDLPLVGTARELDTMIERLNS